MNRIAVVTGASSGMGTWFARICAQEEEIDQLWIIARREERLSELKKEIEGSARKDGKKTPSVKTFAADLGGKSGAGKFLEILENEKKSGEFTVRLLVNNAGFGTYGEFADTSPDWQMDMIELNCTSLTGVTGHCLPYMKEGSRIINVASLAAFAPLGNFAVYGASKAFVLSFSTAIRAELRKRGIKVTALCPGSVSTEFANVASRGARKEVLHGKSAEKTVRMAMKDSRRGKSVSMWAAKWKFNALLCKVLSPEFIAWGTCRFHKRPCADS